MDDGLEEIQSILSETGNNPTRGGGAPPTGSDEDNLASGVREAAPAEDSSSTVNGLERDPIDGEMPKEGDTALEKSEKVNNGGSNGGASIIKNLINNILHPHNGGEEEQKGGDNGVPVNHLPAFTISSVPPAEEASLLIHSIVHD